MSKYQTGSLFSVEVEKEVSCSRIIRVAFESAADTEFDYFVPDEIWPIEVGQRVEVPFGRKTNPKLGFVPNRMSSPKSLLSHAVSGGS